MQIALLYERRWLWVRLPLLLLATLVIALIWQVLYPIAPAHLRMSTGAAQGVYAAYGDQYVQKFAEYGVTVELQGSAGSVENLERLAAGTTDLALVQGGSRLPLLPNNAPRHIGVQTLANIDTEPVWIFTRMRELDSLAQLQSLRVSLGLQGSGSRVVARKLLEVARLQEKDLVLSEVSGMAAASALRNGTLDAAIFVSAAESPVVNAMLSTPGVHLVALKRTAAIGERIPSLEPRLLAQGMLDPSGKHPAQDISMLVSTASLITRESLHPALKRIATAIAIDLHGRGSTFHKPGDFPSLRQLEYPASPEARTTLLRGLPWLDRTFGYWWGQFVWRLLLIVLPVVLAAAWLARLLPAYLHWLLESRVNRWYGELKYIEHDLAQDAISGLDVSKYHGRLARMEAAMAQFATPRDLMQRFYLLHQHIAFVRQQLYRLRGR